MGDPKKQRKKYSTPMHPWIQSNIESEKKIKEEYGLKNKTEIFIANSFLKKYKNIAKALIAKKTEQGEKEKLQILKKLQQLGLLSVGSDLDQILGLEMKDVLERRLQSIVFRKGLAKSINQARQFIVHRHIMVGDKEISMPSYLVSLEEENKIGFKMNSSLASEDHPERINTEAKEIKEEVEAIKDHQKKSNSKSKKKEVEDTEDLDADVLDAEVLEESENLGLVEEENEN
ncbi:MAG: 30S ribosomal protein S4 [Nanoarchaeota archaeon]|nr:30S ribosomal protein S4 [Nanoarchaeota archaeon]MBU1631702.1 30S ribosomal protein S4 [Nanoarchaeota archaeon]MBU1876236.1 30S ribosomal protein S4 [Nanoarchaeota archaeon]